MRWLLLVVMATLASLAASPDGAGAARRPTDEALRISDREAELSGMRALRPSAGAELGKTPRLREAPSRATRTARETRLEASADLRDLATSLRPHAPWRAAPTPARARARLMVFLN